MSRDEAVLKLIKVARISEAYANDLYDSIVPKPVIPYYIADYIEEVKNKGDYTVVGAVNKAPDGRVRDWLFSERVNIFARAWVNGYTVEGEPRYIVKIKATSQWLSNDENWPRFNLNFKTNFTKSELERLGFGWVFSCEGVEVKKVG